MTQSMKKARLALQDGSVYGGFSFGHEGPVAGEVVFNTGMVGYPETFTDPSYAGQILVLTYPMIGNYGIPRAVPNCEIGLPYESDRIQIAGLIVTDYSTEFSHWDALGDLASWLKESKVPALTGVDTRSLTKELRERGTMLGKIVLEGGADVPYVDPNKDNLVAQVSPREVKKYGVGNKRKVVMVDCGAKNNIIGELVARDMEVTRVPWDANLEGMEMDGVMISNGPGDPKQCAATVHQIRRLIARKVPTFGICLGHQLLALAIGADTYKLKYGHRSQNQPVREEGTNRCLVTSQNHGFAVDAKALPDGWVPWFTNLNDGTNEGIRHESLPIRSAQFHPEAAPGPVDANYLFDQFVEMIDGAKK
ncbi:glutamine-hydrolyzing carbamoyl-phosphate synthase small subunit [bacterium]|nr:glutamine-hydrolyzing carbamoyl-phosphate synthase small subunit [bacterium]